MLRPPLIAPEPADGAVSPDIDASQRSAYPKRDRKHRPGWKATLIRSETFALVRAIQKSTRDPAIDMSYLMDACVRIALDAGEGRIVQRALDGMRPVRITTPSSS